MSRRQNFTEKRRARLRKAVNRVERLEPRNTITEPISVTALSLSALHGLGQFGIVQVHGGGDALERLAAASQAARQRGEKVAATQTPARDRGVAYVPVSIGKQPTGGSAAESAGWSQPTRRKAPLLALARGQ